MLLERVLKPLAVVHRYQMRQLLQRHRNALAVGHDLRVVVRFRVPLLKVRHPHGGVEQPVIAALDQKVTVPPRIGAGKPQRGHHRFGAGIGKAHKLCRRDHLGDTLGDREFAFSRQRKDPANLHPPAGGCVHPVVGIAKDRRAIAKPVVDIFIAVDVPGAAALAVMDIDRSVVAPVSEGRGDTERQSLEGFLELGVGLGQVALRRDRHC